MPIRSIPQRFQRDPFAVFQRFTVAASTCCLGVLARRVLGEHDQRGLAALALVLEPAVVLRHIEAHRRRYSIGARTDIGGTNVCFTFVSGAKADIADWLVRARSSLRRSHFQLRSTIRNYLF